MTAKSLRLLDPEGDVDLVHGWVNEPRATYWGMTGMSRAEVGKAYRWVQDQDHLAAYLIHLDDVPVGILQTYDPAVDEIGDYYERRPGDGGLHLFLADSPARAGHTAALIGFMVDQVASRLGARRLVAEPDERNEPSIARLEAAGFSRGPVVQLPHKVAQFMYLDVRR